MRTALTFLLIILISQMSIAATIHVPGDAATIQDAIALTFASDTVLVADGTWMGTGNRDLTFWGKDIVLISENGPESTIIDAQGTSIDPHRCMLFIDGETSVAKVIGFTLKGGFLAGSGTGLVGNGGGVVCIGSSPTFADCIFTENTSSRDGGALYCEEGASPIIISCSFIDNTAQRYGGAFTGGGSLGAIEDCIFTGNSANYAGALLLEAGSNLLLTGCQIYLNRCNSRAGAVWIYSSNPIFQNCTISENISGLGQIEAWVESDPSFNNCIISFGQESRGIFCTGSQVSLYCSDVYGNEGGDYVSCLTGMDTQNGNISLDPLFCRIDPMAPYGLLPNSPCLPDNNACGELMGVSGTCFPDFDLPIALGFGFDPTFADFVLSAFPDIYWTYYDTAATSQSAYEIEVGTDNDWSVAEMWASGEVTSSDTSLTYAGTPLEDDNTYYLRIRLNNGLEWGMWIEYAFNVLLGHAIHIPSDYATIGEGVSAATIGDTVYVAAGTYSGEGNRDIDFEGKPIVVISEAGAESTIIDCGGSEGESHRAFQFVNGENSLSIVDGFKIINGYSSSAGAINCSEASPTIRNCVFENNVGVTNGGAISANGSSMVLENCIFRGNHSKLGSVIYYYGQAKAKSSDTSYISDCLFQENSAIPNVESYSGAIYIEHIGITVNAEGCIFSRNSANAGGAATIYGQATMNVSNCSFVSNRATDNDGGVFCLIKRFESTPELNITNSILAYSTEGEAVYCQDTGLPTISIECSDIYGNAGGDYVGCLAGFEEINNNISANPIFCDMYSGDYLISSGSPCAPDNSGCGPIGAGEVGCEPPHAININYGPNADGNIVYLITPQIYWSYFTIEPTTQAAYEIQVGKDDDWGNAEMWDSGPVYSADTSATYAGASLTDGVQYHVRIRVNDGTNWGNWNQSRFSVYLLSVIHVPGQYGTIQEAVDVAAAGDSILVAPGTYSGEGNRDIHFDGKGIRLVSVAGAESTIIDCGGSEIERHRAFAFTAGEDNSAIVDGFKMINGVGTGIWGQYRGGAIYCENYSSPTIRNCIFEDNTGKSNGGAISAWDNSMVIENCTFTSNHAIYGSAICYNGPLNSKDYGTATITNCKFINNTKVLGEYYSWGVICIQNANMTVNLNKCVFYVNESASGGTIYALGKAIVNISGCTFVGNKSNPEDNGTLVFRDETTLNMENSIIAFNKVGRAVFYGDEAKINIECTDIYGNAGGNWIRCITGLDEGFGNMEENPLFCNAATGDLTLFASSPCLPENNDCGELIGAYGQGCSGYNYQVWKIKEDGSGDAPTIQSAIDQSINGDRILVRNGVYAGDGNRDLDLWGKEILILTEHGPSSTVIDCQGSYANPHRGFRLCNAESPSQMIKGFTIKNGFVPDESDNAEGGAIYLRNSSPTIEDCIFENNFSSRNGGAIAGWDASPVVNSCTFRNNGGVRGAAVYLSAVSGTIQDQGPNPIFRNCSFIDNAGIQMPPEFRSYAGAILIQNGNMQADMDSCLFSGNSADYGSAAICWGNGTLAMTNCTVVGNQSGQPSSGAVMLMSDSIAPTLILNNSILVNNTGSEAVYCSGDANITMACNDIFGNSGGDYTGCIEGFAATSGNISLASLFCNPDFGEFTIQPESPCAPENNGCAELIGAFPAGCSLCGDANQDGSVNITDAVRIINYVFVGGASPNPMSSGNVNCDGKVNVSDAIWIINYVFIGGNAPCDVDGDGESDC